MKKILAECHSKERHVVVSRVSIPYLPAQFEVLISHRFRSKQQAFNWCEANDIKNLKLFSDSVDGGQHGNYD